MQESGAVDLSRYQARIDQQRVLPRLIDRVNRLTSLAYHANEESQGLDLPQAREIMTFACEEAGNITEPKERDDAIHLIMETYVQLAIFMPALAFVPTVKPIALRARWYAKIQAGARLNGDTEAEKIATEALVNTKANLKPTDVKEIEKYIAKLAA